MIYSKRILAQRLDRKTNVCIIAVLCMGECCRARICVSLLIFICHSHAHDPYRSIYPYISLVLLMAMFHFIIILSHAFESNALGKHIGLVKMVTSIAVEPPATRQCGLRKTVYRRKITSPTKSVWSTLANSGWLHVAELYAAQTSARRN